MYILPEPKEIRQGEGAFLAESGMRIVLKYVRRLPLKAISFQSLRIS